MTTTGNTPACIESELLEPFALSVLAPEEQASVGAHLERCARCQTEYQGLSGAVRALASWPAVELQPSSALWGKLAARIGNEGWAGAEDELDLTDQWPELEWENPGPGIYCKVLSTDAERRRVSLLVRLDPGAEYPPHTHAGVEELHLLDGELWIDDNKLFPGDYNLAFAGTSDKRVWSETGCACVLITSPDDVLR